MQQESSELDQVFKALADRTRRSQINLLANGPATIRQLSEPFDMTLPAASKHVKILEQAGLLTCEKIGRSHVCTLNPDMLNLLHEWIAFYNPFWTEKLDNLDTYLEVSNRAPDDQA